MLRRALRCPSMLFVANGNGYQANTSFRTADRSPGQQHLRRLSAGPSRLPRRKRLTHLLLRRRSRRLRSCWRADAARDSLTPCSRTYSPGTLGCHSGHRKSDQHEESSASAWLTCSGAGRERVPGERKIATGVAGVASCGGGASASGLRDGGAAKDRQAGAGDASGRASDPPRGRTCQPGRRG